jgi:hypothetical protein
VVHGPVRALAKVRVENCNLITRAVFFFRVWFECANVSTSPEERSRAMGVPLRFELERAVCSRVLRSLDVCLVIYVRIANCYSD